MPSASAGEREGGREGGEEGGGVEFIKGVATKEGSLGCWDARYEPTVLVVVYPGIRKKGRKGRRDGGTEGGHTRGVGTVEHPDDEDEGLHEE